MKQLQLELNKRLLIVEMTGEFDTVDVFFWNNQPVEKICEGSELTENVAKKFVRFVGGPWSAYVDYNNEKNWISSALESFISAIESKGYHWGENPVKRPIEDSSKQAKWQIKAFKEQEKEWWESESRTFNPSKCIIFEIL
ncbi:MULTISPECIES: hypothetical protein [unclassified Chryseobacterium]|uniref:hypothetical protein n=1 Tax=unclassified Chryseobacterium TaxID=2593645 RepID=UPI0028534122|nr:hypothetical protein [Chryseobacterium sp. CFS7]MDR4892256.1 hypothetical protein [Chryseobacterium sp. CFS7]